MDRVIVLGSASAVPDLAHENTHIYVEAGSHRILIDCPGTPYVRLQQVDVDPISLTDIVITHFHPDHVSGFGSLLMSLWLIGRKAPINIYGLAPTIERAQKMMELYEWQTWPGFYPVNFVIVPSEAGVALIADEDVVVTAAPVQHLIPTIGLRFKFGSSGQVVAYSCDTEASQAVRQLAKGADVLIHESTGSSVGHTAPEQAGKVAAEAGAKSLYLIHYPPQLVEPKSLLEHAQQTFSGPIFIAEDFMTIHLESVERKPE